MPHLATIEHVIELERKLALEKEGVTVLPGVLDLLESILPEDWTINTAGTNAMATARLQQFDIRIPKEMATGDKVINYIVTYLPNKTHSFKLSKVDLW